MVPVAILSWDVKTNRAVCHGRARAVRNSPQPLETRMMRMWVAA